jgi:hypothetical protein
MTFVRFILLGLVLAFAQVWASPLGWVVNDETRPYGVDEDYQPFGPGDTTECWLQSNGAIPINGAPVFYGRVFTHASGFDEGPDFDPQFIGGSPVFNMPAVPLAEVASILRSHASVYLAPGSDRQQRVRITGQQITIWTWYLGVAFDSTNPGTRRDDLPLSGPTCIFSEAPLELYAFNVQGRITIGSAQRIRLLNDVRVGDPHSGPPEYRVGINNANYIGIVSEGDVIIANTYANGRENSSGLGFGQPNQSLTDIVLNAYIVALGSFYFENQNDADSGYVCDCSPDWRGNIWLWGALEQGHRGYLSRTNNGGTGYKLHLRYDPRFDYSRPPCFYSGQDSTHFTTDTLDFGEVPVDSAVWDTVQIYPPLWTELGSVYATLYYYAVRIPPYIGDHFRVPVRFTPPHVGAFDGMLTVITSYRAYQIPLRGRGVEGSAPPIHEPEVYPNPFNAITTFTFSLNEPGHVTLQIFDVNGRLAATLYNQKAPAGRQKVSFNAESLPSGVYFAHLGTPTQQTTMKLLLIK